MSLSIKIEKVYSKNVAIRDRSIDEGQETVRNGIRQSLSQLFREETPIECICVAKFRNNKQTTRVFSQLGGEISPTSSSNNNNNNNLIVFNLGSQLEFNEKLEIDCYTHDSSRTSSLLRLGKRKIGIYKMLLDSLKSEKIIQIDDVLINSKTNQTLNERIKFTLIYCKPELDKQTGRVKEEVCRKKFLSMSNVLDVTSEIENLEEISFMNQSIKRNKMNNQSIKNTSNNKALDKFYRKACNSIASLSKSTSKSTYDLNYDLVTSGNMAEAIYKSCITLARLSFFPGLDAEKDMEEEVKGSKRLRERRKSHTSLSGDTRDTFSKLSSDDFTFDKYKDNNKNRSNIVNLNNSSKSPIVPQLLTPQLNNKITSWQIRLNLIEIKHLLGNNENVYCSIQIGHQSFTSSVKPIDRLKFNEVIFFLLKI
jgi:hypothetical protein